MSITVLLADDQEMIRTGLRMILSAQPGIEVVGEAADGAEAVALARQLRPDVCLFDIRMPGLDGIDTLRLLRERGDCTPVLLLTTFDDSDLLLRAADAGAQGFLLKDASPEELHEAIVRLAAGETLLQPVSTDPVRARFRFHDESAPATTFSEREVAILRLLAGGYSNKEIARSVFLAEGTVKNYVSEILEKLGTRDRTRAVLKAITLRII